MELLMTCIYKIVDTAPHLLARTTTEWCLPSGWICWQKQLGILVFLVQPGRYSEPDMQNNGHKDNLVSLGLILKIWILSLQIVQASSDRPNIFCMYLCLSLCQTSLLCIMGELAGVCSAAVTVGVSDRWQVTRDMWQMTRDMWHVTCDTWHFYSFFLSVSVRFGISATIRTYREIQYIPYAGFFSYHMDL